MIIKMVMMIIIFVKIIALMNIIISITIME